MTMENNRKNPKNPKIWELILAIVEEQQGLFRKVERLRGPQRPSSRARGEADAAQDRRRRRAQRWCGVRLLLSLYDLSQTSPWQGMLVSLL